MTLPEIGEIITTDRALKLCKHFNYHHLVDRIENHPDNYKEWKFDGASMVCDRLLSRLCHIPNLIEIALKHDLKYAYGEKGNKAEKRQADLDLERDLIEDGTRPMIARMMFKAVDIGGQEHFNFRFSWAFAHK